MTQQAHPPQVRHWQDHGTDVSHIDIYGLKTAASVHVASQYNPGISRPACVNVSIVYQPLHMSLDLTSEGAIELAAALCDAAAQAREVQRAVDLTRALAQACDAADSSIPAIANAARNANAQQGGAA